MNRREADLEETPDGAVNCRHCDKLFVPTEWDGECPRCGWHVDDDSEVKGEHYGRVDSTGELIGPYDTVAELNRELADSEREATQGGNDV